LTRREYKFYVYIMSSQSGTLYTGFSNSIYDRALQHKQGKTKGFTQKYGCNRLVYYEQFQYVRSAIAREDEIKGWSRKKKIAMIESINPKWDDLAEGWGGPIRASFRGQDLGDSSRQKKAL
jgi:putative endonuclease